MTILQPREMAQQKKLNRVLHALISAAEMGDVCPENRVLARIGGYSSAGTASDAVAILESEGLISRKIVRGRRVVTITATGKSTSLPEFQIDKDSEEWKPRRPVREIVQIAADIFNVPAKDISSDSRFKVHTKPRMAVFRVAADQGWPLSHIGRIMGKDHSTVIYGRRKANVLARDCQQYAEALNRLIEQAKPGVAA